MPWIGLKQDILASITGLPEDQKKKPTIPYLRVQIGHPAFASDIFTSNP